MYCEKCGGLTRETHIQYLTNPPKAEEKCTLCEQTVIQEFAKSAIMAQKLSGITEDSEFYMSEERAYKFAETHIKNIGTELPPKLRTNRPKIHDAQIQKAEQVIKSFGRPGDES